MADIVLKNRRGDSNAYNDVDGVKLYTEDGRAEVFTQSEDLSGCYAYIGKPTSNGILIMSKGGSIGGTNAKIVNLRSDDMQEYGSPITYEPGVLSSWFIVSKLPLEIGKTYDGFDIIMGKV